MDHFGGAGYSDCRAMSAMAHRSADMRDERKRIEKLEGQVIQLNLEIENLYRELKRLEANGKQGL